MRVLELALATTHNVCQRSDFFFKMYITAFEMPNYPFGSNYPPVKKHCCRATTQVVGIIAWSINHVDGDVVANAHLLTIHLQNKNLNELRVR